MPLFETEGLGPPSGVDGSLFADVFDLITAEVKASAQAVEQSFAALGETGLY